jgi:23S rRNA pseudouridine955/2504/2580 synthase
MSGVETIAVAEDEAGLRLDRWFKRHYPGLTHGRLEKMLRTGQVRLDGKRVRANARINGGQMIRVPPVPDDTGERSSNAPPTVSAGDAEAIQASVLYRDNHLIAINKPPGLAVQGGTGTSRHVDAMLDALRFDGKDRPRLVHRLDKDTSGVLLIARTVSAAIKKGGGGSEKVYAATDGKRAVTNYMMVDRASDKLAWLALAPETGRTHQLRVHCAMIGNPILGDGKYGGKGAFPEGAGGIAAKMQLHARWIRVFGMNGEKIEVTAPLTEHMKSAWKFFGFDENAAPNNFENGEWL